MSHCFISEEKDWNEGIKRDVDPSVIGTNQNIAINKTFGNSILERMFSMEENIDIGELL